MAPELTHQCVHLFRKGLKVAIHALRDGFNSEIDGGIKSIDIGIEVFDFSLVLGDFNGQGIESVVNFLVVGLGHGRGK
jgi:hypothetical protein